MLTRLKNKLKRLLFGRRSLSRDVVSYYFGLGSIELYRQYIPDDNQPPYSYFELGWMCDGIDDEIDHCLPLPTLIQQEFWTGDDELWLS